MISFAQQKWTIYLICNMSIDSYRDVHRLTKPVEQTRVVVGMSGGVDSSVSAYLLKQQGFQVEGLFMKNWEEDDTDTYCSASQDKQDAQAVCDRLGIPFHSINFAVEYWDNVFEYFLKEYQAGRTPNPDILCNREIKFKAFLAYAQTLGADFIATGHYARCQALNNQYQLLKGLDPNKDQSYFLYAVAMQALGRTIFPLGHLKKPEVRDIAKTVGFANHGKKDSTGICFIGERKFKTFLQTYLPAQPGLIQTPQGTIVGKHDGLMYYTLGQRSGLQIGGRKHSKQAPWYVLAKDLKNNILYVGQDHEHPWLMSKTLTCAQCHWISGQMPEARSPSMLTAKIRYRSIDIPCHLKQISDDQFQVQFIQAQRAITPGQSIVFYLEDVCLGGAVIESYQHDFSFD